MDIRNDKQLKTAQEFVKFLKEHNRRALAVKNADAEDIYDIAVRQASLINEMAKSLAVKQTEINVLREEAKEFRSQIDELEREIRVSKDLLAIAKVVTDDVK